MRCGLGGAFLQILGDGLGRQARSDSVSDAPTAVPAAHRPLVGFFDGFFDAVLDEISDLVIQHATNRSKNDGGRPKPWEAWLVCSRNSLQWGSMRANGPLWCQLH
jgi:hypothetical protein